MPDEKELWVEIDSVEGMILEMHMRYDKRGAEVLDFVLQLATRPAESEESDRIIIRRYDCSHEGPHMDVYNRAGEQTKMYLLHLSRSDALTYAQNDIRRNRRRILAEYLRS